MDRAPVGLHAWLKASAARSGTRPFLTFMGRTQTYEAVKGEAARRATALVRLGMQPGEGIGLLLEDGPALQGYYIAALAVGARPILLDPSAPAEVLSGALKASASRILITSDTSPLYTKATQLLAFSLVDRVVVVPFASQVSSVSAVALKLSGKQRTARIAATPSGPVVREADLLRDNGAAIELPHPAPASEERHRSEGVRLVLADLADIGRGMERIVAAVPLSNALAHSLATGIAVDRAAEMIIPDSLDVADVSRALLRHRPGVLLVSPARLAAILAQAGNGDALRGLKLVLTVGGEPTAQMLAAYAAVTRAPLRVIFSAAGAPVALGGFEHDADAAVSTAGIYRPLPETRFVVRDVAEPTREVPRGERGAVYVAGPQFDACSADADGFRPTGVVGLIDGAGRIVVIDRLGELVVAAGYMIYPRRIEAALREHAGVAEVAVVGVSDGKRGNAPKAFVRLKTGATVTERDLMKHLGERISKIEMPADIDFCSFLPLNAFGEIDRRALKERAQ